MNHEFMKHSYCKKDKMRTDSERVRLISGPWVVVGKWMGASAGGKH